jgi:hypothetical protein
MQYTRFGQGFLYLVELTLFMNGETLGLRAKLPHRFDLSDLTWKGNNYLAIEVAIFINRKVIAARGNLPCIIGDVRLFTK